MTNKKWVDKVVIPGDIITSTVDSFSENAKLGPGLQHRNNEVKVCRSGRLRYKEPDMFWVDFDQKRYVPCKGDCVIGVVTARQGDFYRVDIGSSDQAILSSFSFEGASKRNRPNIEIGDIVFGKLVIAHRDIEPEISCVEPSNGKAKGMGLLQSDGFLFKVPLPLARKVLSPECVLLAELGNRCAFELTVGLNGLVFISARSNREVIALMDVIIASASLSNQQIVTLLTDNYG